MAIKIPSSFLTFLLLSASAAQLPFCCFALKSHQFNALYGVLSSKCRIHNMYGCHTGSSWNFPQPVCNMNGQSKHTYINSKWCSCLGLKLQMSGRKEDKALNQICRNVLFCSLTSPPYFSLYVYECLLHISVRVVAPFDFASHNCILKYNFWLF